MTVFTFFTGVAHADQYDAQIAAAKQAAAQQQTVANQFAAQAHTYQERVNQLNAQIGALQAQINLNQAEYNRVTANIAANEVKLAEQKAALGSNIKQMYLNSGVTPLEMIASSKNLSEYFDQQQYQDTIKNKIQSAMASVLEIQTKLASQKVQVTAILEQQQSQRQQLAQSQSEANQLLATAAQNADAANSQVRQSNARAASLEAQQAAALAAQYSSTSTHYSSSGSCGGGYPGSASGRFGTWGCNYGKDDGVDSWAMYNRECVSYTAFRIGSAGRGNPSNFGNARDWPGNARAAGISVTSVPRAGDIAINQSPSLPYGHAMYVERVNGDGSIFVSQYNFGNRGEYSTMTITSAGLSFIHF